MAMIPGLEEKCKNNLFRSFGKNLVERVENLDGFKFFLNDDEWVITRSSGTEPVLIIYAESHNRKSSMEILNNTIEGIMAE